MASTVRIDPEIHRLLKDSARKEGVSMQEILRKALEAYRRRLVLKETNAAYAVLRADPKARSAWKGEQEELEGTLGDGLDGEDR